MKTLKKAMCIVLCVIMAFSCVSLAASAESETVNSSVKFYTQKLIQQQCDECNPLHL